MKNVVIGILMTYIFYTDFCVIQIPIVIPFVFFIFWILLEESEQVFSDYMQKIHRGRKLGRKIKKLRRS